MSRWDPQKHLPGLRYQLYLTRLNLECATSTACTQHKDAPSVPTPDEHNGLNLRRHLKSSLQLYLSSHVKGVGMCWNMPFWLWVHYSSLSSSLSRFFSRTHWQFANRENSQDWRLATSFSRKMLKRELELRGVCNTACPKENLQSDAVDQGQQHCTVMWKKNRINKLPKLILTGLALDFWAILKSIRSCFPQSATPNVSHALPC